MAKTKFNIITSQLVRYRFDAAKMGHPQTYQIWECVSDETDESGIKLQIEEGFTRKDLGSNGL